ncbi:hypothetical protein DNTS_001921, partial [Danionella cerebrum]
VERRVDLLQRVAPSLLLRLAAARRPGSAASLTPRVTGSSILRSRLRSCYKTGFRCCRPPTPRTHRLKSAGSRSENAPPRGATVPVFRSPPSCVSPERASNPACRLLHRAPPVRAWLSCCSRSEPERSHWSPVEIGGHHGSCPVGVVLKPPQYCELKPSRDRSAQQLCIRDGRWPRVQLTFKRQPHCPGYVDHSIIIKQEIQEALFVLILHHSKYADCCTGYRNNIPLHSTPSLSTTTKCTNQMVTYGYCNAGVINRKWYTADEGNFLFKFLVIGNAGTGKSCLLHQFIEKRFKDDSNHTIGVEFGSKIISVVNKSVKLQIWDTAGQERF